MFITFASPKRSSLPPGIKERARTVGDRRDSGTSKKNDLGVPRPADSWKMGKPTPSFAAPPHLNNGQAPAGRDTARGVIVRRDVDEPEPMSNACFQFARSRPSL